MSMQVGSPNYNNIINATKKAIESNSAKGKDISKEELNSIVKEIQSSGATAEEATRVINDTLKKQGSTQVVKLTTQDINNATTFSFKVGGKSNTSQANSTQIKPTTNTTQTTKTQNTKPQNSTSSTAKPQSSSTSQKPAQTSKPQQNATKYEVEASFQLNKEVPKDEEPKKETTVQEQKPTPKEETKVETKVEQPSDKKEEVKPENKTETLKTPPKKIVTHKHKKDFGDKLEDAFEDLGRDIKKAGKEIKRDLRRLGHKIDKAFDGDNIKKKIRTIDCPKF